MLPEEFSGAIFNPLAWTPIWDMDPTFRILVHFHVLLRLWRVVNSMTVRCCQQSPTKLLTFIAAFCLPHLLRHILSYYYNLLFCHVCTCRMV